MNKQRILTIIANILLEVEGARLIDSRENSRLMTKLSRTIRDQPIKPIVR